MTTSNGKLYKYAYGSTSDFSIAKEDLKVVQSKGTLSLYYSSLKMERILLYKKRLNNYNKSNILY
jgi:hypothetical protein